MKALMIGGDGLLGSHLIRQWLKCGNSARVFVQRGSASPTLRDLPIERVEGDLLDENGALAEAVRGCECVFHCAAITDLWADPKLVWKVNLDGTRKVIEACVRGVAGRLIFTGSASSFQFGTMENPGDERGLFPEAYRGIAYMESKYQATQLVRETAKRGDLDAVIVAPTFMLGDLDFRPSSGELIRQFVLRRMRYTSGGGRNFVCAADVAAAMILAVEKGRCGETYIAGGRNMSYMDFFSAVARAADLPPPRGVLPDIALLAAGAAGSAYEKITGRRAPLDLRMMRMALLGTYYQPQKAIDELGMPQTPIETGIEQTLRGLREFGHI